MGINFISMGFRTTVQAVTVLSALAVVTYVAYKNLLALLKPTPPLKNITLEFQGVARPQGLLYSSGTTMHDLITKYLPQDSGCSSKDVSIIYRGKRLTVENFNMTVEQFLLTHGIDPDRMDKLNLAKPAVPSRSGICR